jgi:hypothetical protein
MVCGRRLTDPESVQRGIGPVCWRNLKKEDEKVKERHKIWNQCKHNSEDQEGIDLQDLSHLIYVKKPRCICGARDQWDFPEHYEHDGGIKVKGYKELQWVYVHCRNCNYDMALWKIRRELK